jgi:hypothetical protein
MKKEREMAVEAMQAMGWTATREKTSSHPRWVFPRADTGGLWDRITVTQANLRMSWVAEKAMQHGDADDLVAEIHLAKTAWLQRRFLGIYSRANEP